MQQCQLSTYTGTYLNFISFASWKAWLNHCMVERQLMPSLKGVSGAAVDAGWIILMEVQLNSRAAVVCAWLQQRLGLYVPGCSKGIVDHVLGSLNSKRFRHCRCWSLAQQVVLEAGCPEEQGDQIELGHTCRPDWEYLQPAQNSRQCPDQNLPQSPCTSKFHTCNVHCKQA